MTTQQPIDIWREKLEHFQRAEAITVNPNLRFQLQKQIEEARQRISELQTDIVQPTVLGQSPSDRALWLEPSGSNNWVQFLDDKYQQNSRYAVDVHFHLIIGPRRITLLEFEGTHYAKGCAALKKQPHLRFNGQAIDFASDWFTLTQPYRVEQDAVVAVEYKRLFQPPLMNMCAVDCDYGDLQMRLRFRVGNVVEEAIFCVELLPHGCIKPIDHVRQVPQVNDAKLKEFVEKGLLSKEQYEKLMRYPAENRYRAAHSDNESENYLGIADPHRALLRSLVKGRLGVSSPPQAPDTGRTNTGPGFTLSPEEMKLVKAVMAADTAMQFIEYFICDEGDRILAGGQQFTGIRYLSAFEELRQKNLLITRNNHTFGLNMLKLGDLLNENPL